MRKLRSPILWLGIAGVLAAYALFGFFAVPRIVTSLARDSVRTDYGRELRIGELRFNPFTFTLEVRQLLLPDADGSPLLSFDRLLVDLELNSIWRRALSFRGIGLDGLVLNAVVRPGGALNLADLQPPASDGPVEPLPRIFIADLSVNAGRVHFEDRDRPEPFVANLAPLTFRLTDFSTYVAEADRYELDARLFDTARLVWRGTLLVEPFASDGEFTLSDLPLPRVAAFLGDALPLDVSSGAATLQGRYRFADGRDAVRFEVDDGSLAATKLAVRPRGEQTDYVSLDRMTAKGLRLSLEKATASIAELAVDGGQVAAWLNAGGDVNLAALAGPGQSATARTDAAPGPTTSPPAATAPPAAPAAGPDWEIGIARIALRNLAIAVEDRSLSPAAAATLQPFNLSVTGFSTRPGTSVETVVDSRINGSGHLQVTARTNLDSLATEAEVDLADFDLELAQPYLARETSLTLTGGALAANGQLTYADAEPAKLGFAGEVTVNGFRSIDNVLSEDFVKWRSLRLSGLEYQTAPEALRIREVVASDPYARVIIGPDGTTNIAAILGGPGAVGRAADGPTIGPAGSRDKGGVVVTNPSPQPESPGGPAVPFPVRIDKVRIDGGSANFADFTTRPNFQIGIQRLRGTVASLSSDPASRAKVELDGQVDRFSPVTIRGDVNPLAAETFLDMAMTFRNVELASFTPYSGRFAGYSIRQGKLSADLNYKVNDRKLDANHKFVIDQLELGDKVESADSVGLPLKLAVALLRDRNGVIDLNLPVTGDLDDPKFRIGPIVWKVFVNLITKAVTAPFALLGSLFGGGEDVNIISFPAGIAALDAAGQEKLGSLVKALTERPGLQLSVPAVYNRAADSPTLVEQALEQRVVAATRAELAARRKPLDGVDFATVSADRSGYLKELKALWQKDLGAGQDVPEPPPPAEGAPDPSAADALEARISALESAIRQRIEITDADLFELARRRAEVVQSALLTGTGIEPARVFLTSPVEGKAADDAVQMELALR